MGHSGFFKAFITARTAADLQSPQNNWYYTMNTRKKAPQDSYRVYRKERYAGDKGKKEVVLTEGELDMMSLHQANGGPAISGPNGASSLPPHTLTQLGQFERIVLRRE